MPWRERSLMDVRLRFVQDVHRPGWSIAEVCRRYEVSRKTGYKWLERYEKAGPAGLVDRSHRPYSCPHATPGPIVQQILALQRRQDLLHDRPRRRMRAAIRPMRAIDEASRSCFLVALEPFVAGLPAHLVTATDLGDRPAWPVDILHKPQSHIHE